MTSYLELARLHKLLALSYRLTTELRQTPEISLCYFGPFAFFVYHAMVEQATVSRVSPHTWRLQWEGWQNLKDSAGQARVGLWSVIFASLRVTPSNPATMAMSRNLHPPQPPTATKQTDRHPH